MPKGKEYKYFDFPVNDAKGRTQYQPGGPVEEYGKMPTKQQGLKKSTYKKKSLLQRAKDAMKKSFKEAREYKSMSLDEVRKKTGHKKKKKHRNINKQR